MKNFIRKGIVKKLIIILIAITLFSAIIPPKIAYAGTKDVVSTVGGSLLSPVASLMIGFGDAVMNLIHDLVYDMDSSFILISMKDDVWGIILTIAAAIVMAVIVFAVTYYTAGAGLALLAKLGVAVGTTLSASAIGTIAVASVAVGIYVGTVTATAWFGDNIIFPVYKVTPEEIFKGEVAMLDVNFFKEDEKIKDEEVEVETATIIHKKSVLEEPVTIEYDVRQEGVSISSAKEGIDYLNEVLKNYGYEGEYINCLVPVLAEER